MEHIIAYNIVAQTKLYLRAYNIVDRYLWRYNIPHFAYHIVGKSYDASTRHSWSYNILFDCFCMQKRARSFIRNHSASVLQVYHKSSSDHFFNIKIKASSFVIFAIFIQSRKVFCVNSFWYRWQSPILVHSEKSGFFENPGFSAPLWGGGVMISPFTPPPIL